MAKVLVSYYSRTGHTRKMAEKIAGRMKEEGLEVVLKRVEETSVEELPGYQALILGSPTYYGTMAWEVKKLLDESVKFHSKLRGRVGGAFSSSANVGGGNETTVLDILKALMIHGLIIQGSDRGDHYGPVAVGRPDARSLKGCEDYARGLAALIKKLFP
ncbi:MAG: flavodoxin [Candidatus Aminicenantes bacterium RBG_13_63_10]|nr:MAG: flavodoxin [Candidatus Aminicenantes bacterium RBG_13_63_10]